MKLTLTFALQASQIMRQIGFVLTSVLLAKSGLPISDIGVFETLLFIGTTLSYFWINGLIQSQLAFMPTISEKEKQSVNFSIALLFIGLSIVLYFTLILFPTLVLSALTAAPSLPYFDLFVLYLLFNLPPFFIEGYLIIENKPLSILAFSSLSNLVLPFVIVIPLWLKQPFIVSFYGLIIIGLMRFIYLVYFLIYFLIQFIIKNKTTNNNEIDHKTVNNNVIKGKIINNKSIIINYKQLDLIQLLIKLKRIRIIYLQLINYPQLKRFIQLSLPIMSYSLLNGFTMSFIFWIVGYYLSGDTAAFAVFRFGAREFPLVMALTTGLSNAFVPILAEKLQFSEKNQKNTEGSSDVRKGNTFYEIQLLKSKTRWLWHILFPSSIVLMLSSKWLFPIVFNHQFKESAAIFNIFLLLLVSRALFPQTILLALKQTKTLLIISIIETISIVLMSFLGIYWFNTEGVAWALVIGFLIEKIMIVVVLKRQFSIDFKDYTDVKWYFMYSIALILSYFIAF